MDSIVAFFLGLLTMLLILLPFWYIASFDTTIKTSYANTICWKICNPDDLYKSANPP
jgi:hypothetical protein